MESNDSPEIPDKGETSDIRSLPSGVWLSECYQNWYESAKLNLSLDFLCNAQFYPCWALLE